jgi:hypothetical protein
LARDRSVLILGTPRRRWSLPLVRGGKTMDAVEELSVPLSGLLCSRCKLEWNGEDANHLRGIVLPLLGSDLLLIF